MYLIRILDGGDEDEEGNTAEVPELELENEEQLKRFVEGMAIKKMSKQKRQLLDEEIEAYSKDNLLEACMNEKCDTTKLV